MIFIFDGTLFSAAFLLFLDIYGKNLHDKKPSVETGVFSLRNQEQETNRIV